MNNLYAGADGCPGGWVAALLDEQFRFQPLTVYPALAALVTALSGVEALLVDIPMGLREQGDERACDLETRRLLGSRGSTLFRVPVRAAVHEQDYRTASDRNRAATGKGISAQTFGICKKIAEADLLLRANPDLQRWVYESHPEACFAVLNDGSPLPEKKKSPEGQKRRLELISRYSPNAAQTFTEARDRFRRSDVADDDILDAMGLALAAHLCLTRGMRSIPAEPEVDSHGLRMAIVVPSLSNSKPSLTQVELLVIRHGQSVADLEERHEGRADFPLTDLGREQARKMAAWVARECPPDAIWASPLKRAAEVAQILGRATGLPVRTHPGLMEWDNGHLAGLTRQEALIKYPPPQGRRLPHVPIPGGESEIQFRARVEATFHEILAAHPEGRVAIVAHGARSPCSSGPSSACRWTPTSGWPPPTQGRTGGASRRSAGWCWWPTPPLTWSAEARPRCGGRGCGRARPLPGPAPGWRPRSAGRGPSGRSPAGGPSPPTRWKR